MKEHTNVKPFFYILIFLMSIIGLVNCGGGSTDEPEADKDNGTPIVVKVDISGRVTGSGALADVSVTAGGKSTTSDANGAYLLQDVAVPENGRVVLTYEKAGYGTYQRSLIAEGGETYAVEAKLLQYHLSETINNGTQSQTLSASDNAGTLVSLTLDDDSLNTDDVTVNIATGDPTTEEGRAVFPGDYMAATTAGGEPDTPLESIAYTEISISDDQGNELTNLDKPANLKVRLPAAYQTDGEKSGTYVPGDAEKGSIEWWSYDETNATWIREDADPSTAELDDAAVIDDSGVLYAEAKVTHFSWWNADKPIYLHACLCVQVVDENNNPVKDALVVAEGVTYNGRSTPQKTDSQGRACVTVKRTMEPTTPDQVKIYVEYGGVNFFYDVTNPDEGDVDNNHINTPEEQGSTLGIIRTGTCTTLENTLVVSFNGTVTGKISYEGGAPASDFTLHSTFGSTANTDAQGNYSIRTPIDVEVMLFAPGLASKTVTTTQAEPDKVIDFLIPNRAPVINNFSRNPTGLIGHGATVTLEVQASDPDGDAINYSWNVDGDGTLNQNTGNQVIWTAPATGINDDLITVTVTDSHGKQASQSLTINWGGTTGGNLFKVTIRDNRINKEPVSGVTVAVYSSDNQTIQSTKTSDAQGVVNFGDLGRNRSSVTIAYANSDFRKSIDTFVDIPLGDYVYYLDTEFEGFCNPSLASIDISVPGIPANAGYTWVLPTFTYIGRANPTSAANICTEHLQSDGKLSFLAQSIESFSNPEILRYGFLLDQTVTDGDTYTIDLNTDGRLPGSTQLTTTGDLPDVASISGIRSGVTYQLGSNNEVTSENSVVLTANEFPSDFFMVSTERALGTNFDAPRVYASKNYGTLPQSVEVNLPDYNFTDAGYDKSSNTFSWTLTGSSPRDHFDLDFRTGFSELDRTDWSVFLPSDSSSWKVMPLPAPADTWIDTTKLDEQVFTAALEVIDYDTLTGADEFIEYFATGGSFYDIGAFNQQLSGQVNIQVTPPLFTKPTQKAVADTQETEPTIQIPLRPQGAAGGFVRR